MSIAVRIKFGRKGPVRYTGHLDMMRYFQKAVLRSGIPAKYTEGFHPHQIMAFAYPLGVSMETEGDYMDLELTEAADPVKIKEALNAVMNEGIRVLSVTLLPEKAANAMASVAAADYRLEIAAGENTEAGSASRAEEDVEARAKADLTAALSRAAEKLLACESIPVGEKAKDIRPGIYSLQVDGNNILMQLSSGSRLNVRPADVWECMREKEPALQTAECAKIVRLEIYGRTAEETEAPLDRLYKATETAEDKAALLEQTDKAASGSEAT